MKSETSVIGRVLQEEAKGKRMTKQKQRAGVISQQEIAPGIYDMWIATDLADYDKPGQFI